MTTTDERRAMVETGHKSLSISEQCEILELPRSTFYYSVSKAYSDRDLLMMRCLDDLHFEDSTRGTQHMQNELIKLGFKVGRAHLRTLMRVMRLKTVYCRPRTTIIDPAKYKYPYLLRNLEISRPNQAWGIDITYIPMPKGFMYLTAIIDLYSRYIVGWSPSNSMETEWVTSTVKEAVRQHGKPDIINSDQGSQFTSDCYIDYIKNLEHTKISMDGKGRALDNVYIERFWRTIKYDKIHLVAPETCKELYIACREFVDYYNEKRDHSSLNNKTPLSVYQQAA